MPRPCVIFNPAAASGAAAHSVTRAAAEAGNAFDLIPTERPGHAAELARHAVERGVPVVIAAGGDGTVHEVANGLLDSGDPTATLSIWPVGSANDYAHALGLCHWWRQPGRFALPRTVRTADVGRVTGGGRSRWYVNCLGLGFNGAVTLESRRIRGLRGMWLYGAALLAALGRHFTHLRAAVRFDGVLSPHARTLVLSVNLGRREGGFPLTGAARLNDGLLDYVHGGALSRAHLVRFLPNLALGTLPDRHPLLSRGQCRRVEIAAAAPFRVHADGEFFCHPEDGIRELVVEVVPARLRVETWPSAPPTALALS